MPKKTLNRWMPDAQKLRNNPMLHKLGDSFHHAAIWHMNRRSASRAVMIGLFCAFLPIPMQMLPAVILCIAARANLPLAIGCVWLTNPLTIGPVFYATYKIGAILLDMPVHANTFHLSMDWFIDRFSFIWKPLLLGSLLCGTGIAAIGYTLVDLLWRRHTLRRWRNRPHGKNR